MKHVKLLLLCNIVMILSACSNNYEDLDQWMKEKTLLEKGHIKELPPAKTFIPVSFKATSDPFKEKPIMNLNLKQSQYAPNPDRRKEQLEKYTLETLKMVGTIQKDKTRYALIKTPEGTINKVTLNNYMGTNYGKIITISEGEILLDERIKNSNDEWISKKTAVQLEEAQK